MTLTTVVQPYSRTFTIDKNSDVRRVRRAVRALARGLGFTEVQEYELAIAVSELAQNLVHHATAGGTIIVQSIEKEGRGGIEVFCRDQGPGISDIAQSLQDGFSTTGSLGGGLGTVQRMADEFHIESPPEAGLTIIFRKYT
ncbi:MAG: anti-sigma regulatory factor [Chloroflexi bacterium]|nr:anti-sigma regulatory factor [Chloroflexota bacterium]